jgi:hypothetical protein
MIERALCEVLQSDSLYTHTPFFPFSFFSSLFSSLQISLFSACQDPRSTFKTRFSTHRKIKYYDDSKMVRCPPHLKKGYRQTRHCLSLTKKIWNSLCTLWNMALSSPDSFCNLKLINNALSQTQSNNAPTIFKSDYKCCLTFSDIAPLLNWIYRAFSWVKA